MESRRGRKVMVVITDGGDTPARTAMLTPSAQPKPAETIVYSIINRAIEASAGRDTGGEHALIQISTDTGGKYYYATSLPQTRRRFSQNQRRAPHAIPTRLLPG